MPYGCCVPGCVTAKGVHTFHFNQSDFASVSLSSHWETLETAPFSPALNTKQTLFPYTQGTMCTEHRDY